MTIEFTEFLFTLFGIVEQSLPQSMGWALLLAVLNLLQDVLGVLTAWGAIYVWIKTRL